MNETLKEKFDKEFPQPRKILKPAVWKWITSVYTPVIINRLLLKAEFTIKIDGNGDKKVVSVIMVQELINLLK